ncbi:hypothetical protein GKC56_08135 [Neisseriaceae bacterium PsAf]|nr:hypothetical protein [Neisseriaceae bacterium PsAf]MCV2502615.1 hypothetical protein [Neisseriaceae bacterium]
MKPDDIIAKQIKTQALQAIQDLARIFDIQDVAYFKEYEIIREGICRAIGEIDTSLLLTIYQKYPELDDLKEKSK